MYVISIHASALSSENKAFIFLGPSGTGKSTIRRLFSDTYHSVADDYIYLVERSAGQWVVIDANCGVNPKSSAELYALASASPVLTAIFRLYQAPVSSCEAMNSLEVCRCLTNAFFEIPQPREVNKRKKVAIENRKKVFSNLAMVSKWIQGYRLYFSLTQFETLKPKLTNTFDKSLNTKGV